MNKIDFRLLANPAVRNLTPYQPGKPQAELERELGITSSIKLASNENPLGPSPQVHLAAQQVLAQAHIYPDGSCYELKQALAAAFAVQPAHITVGNGSENILELIVKAYLHQGDHAIISQYAFLTIPILLSSYGVTAKVVPAREWGHDIDAMIAAVDDQTRVLFLVNPNNPTGTYVSDADFQRLLSEVPPQVLVVVDEAYAEYISRADYPQTLAYLARYPNLLITRTFSKVYGLAALRLGFALSSIEIADMLNRVRLPFNVNSVAAACACAALRDVAHVQKSVEVNETGMRQMQTGLQCYGLHYIPSVGNFITIDVGDASDVYQQLLHKGVIVRPLTAYDMPRHIRVTIGTARENQVFLAALESVMQASVYSHQEASAEECAL